MVNSLGPADIHGIFNGDRSGTFIPKDYRNMSDVDNLICLGFFSMEEKYMRN